ncbi:hypothetical protein ABH307_00425 [Acinetobacter pittii]|uniref:hypothetical protein n=1 Tax=Acinetobacter pittii TaxID=48296 RepID=UPI003260028F
MNEHNEFNANDSAKQLKAILQELKPTMIREAFLVELLLAYDKIDDNLKKRLLAINARFNALDKRLISISNLDNDIRDKLLMAVNERLNDVLLKFETDLKTVSDPLADQKAELKKIGREVLKAHKLILDDIDIFIKNTHNLNDTFNKFNTLSKWLPFFVIITIISVMLNSILVWKLFF